MRPRPGVRVWGEVSACACVGFFVRVRVRVNLCRRGRNVGVMWVWARTRVFRDIDEGVRNCETN